MTRQRIPLTVSAGALLRGELRARGWTQGQFAQMLGRPDQWVSEQLMADGGLRSELAAIRRRARDRCHRPDGPVAG